MSDSEPETVEDIYSIEPYRRHLWTLRETPCFEVTSCHREAFDFVETRKGQEDSIAIEPWLGSMRRYSWDPSKNVVDSNEICEADLDDMDTWAGLGAVFYSRGTFPDPNNLDGFLVPLKNSEDMTEWLVQQEGTNDTVYRLNWKVAQQLISWTSFNGHFFDAELRQVLASEKSIGSCQPCRRYELRRGYEDKDVVQVRTSINPYVSAVTSAWLGRVTKGAQGGAASAQMYGGDMMICFLTGGEKQISMGGEGGYSRLVNQRQPEVRFDYRKAEAPQHGTEDNADPSDAEGEVDD